MDKWNSALHELLNKFGKVMKNDNYIDSL